MAIARKLHIPDWDDAAVREAIQDNRGPLFIATPAATRLDALAAAAVRATPADLARLGFAVAHAIQGDAPAVSDLSGAMAARAESIARALRQAERPLVISGTALGDEALIQAAANVAWALGRRRAKRRPCTTARRNATAWGSGSSGASPWRRPQTPSKGRARASCSSWRTTCTAGRRARCVERIRAAARHLIVLDHVAGPTAAMADMVLPAATFAEGTGTVRLGRRAGPALLPGFRTRRRCPGKLALDPGNHGRGERSPGRSWSNLDDITAAMGEAIPGPEDLEGPLARSGFPHRGAEDSPTAAPFQRQDRHDGPSERP